MLMPTVGLVQYLFLYFNTDEQMGPIKRKSALEHVQNAQIQLILHMHKVSSGPVLSVHTFCSIK